MDQRRQFINEVLEGQKPFCQVCQDYGISPKTGYKWFERFKQEGGLGLMDRSRRPHRTPQRLEEEAICELISFKLAHSNWGPKKIRELYERKHGQGPSLSSVNRVLKRAGLVKKRLKRRRVAGGRLVSQIKIQGPNDVWTMDFKGWWFSGDQKRVEPFTVRDAYSRYILVARDLGSINTQTVKQALIRVFRVYGMPQVIQCDNGTPFGVRSNILGISQLSAWLISLGIQMNYSRPGHPQDNGGHERMHKDLKEEVQVQFRGDYKEYQAELDIWRETFNTQRPHEKLTMKTPGEVYHKSQRKYPETPVEIIYPSTYRTRKVSSVGMIKLFNQRYFLTRALRGQPVGLKVLDSRAFGVYYCQVFLGKIDLETVSFQPAQNV